MIKLTNNFNFQRSFVFIQTNGEQSIAQDHPSTTFYIHYLHYSVTG